MNRKLLAFCIGVLATLSVSAQTAVINASTLSGCAPLTVTFTDGSAGATSWNWDFGNGNTSTLQNPPVQPYLAPGTYTVTLSINGGASSAQVTVTIHSSPAVNFKASDTTGTNCFPLPENFTDLSNPNGSTIVSWDWDFGDGTTSTLENPSHTYTGANAFGFPVTLQVTASNGCQSTVAKLRYIVIDNGVTASFTSNAASGCKVPTTVAFQSNSTGPGTLTYAWNFGNGTSAGNVTSATSAYSATGSYPVVLTVSSSSGCTAVDTQNVVITGGNVQSTFSGPDSACTGTPVVFKNTSVPNPSVANWDFGDGNTSAGQTVSHTYTTAGIYSVKLVNVFGSCNDSVTQQITVLSPPVASFTSPDTVGCSANLTVNFTDHSTNATTWSWNFGDGTTGSGPNPTHTYTAFGSYAVTETVSNSTGCSDVVTKTAFINILQPSLSINPNPGEGCAPYVFIPSISSSIAGGISSYSWTFGDGSNSNLAAPTHTYAAGNYLVNLTIMGKGGCSISATDSVKVGSIKPTAAFIATPIPQCVDQPVQFTDQSSGGVNTWHWDFGDMGSSNAQDPTHVYTTPGIYTISEYVYNNGCGDTLVKSSYVVVNVPMANFTYTTDCSAGGEQFTFTDQSQGANTWSWNFGDGTTSNVQNPPAHVFPGSPTNFAVSLTVTNAATGCTDTKTMFVSTAIEKAVFQASPTSVCTNTAVYVSTVNVVDSNVAEYKWDFGDGNNPLVGPHLQLTHGAYSAPGVYTITLVIVNNSGCIDSSSQKITVNAPVVQFSANAPGACTALNAVFTDQSTDAAYPIVKWVWNWGDGSPAQTYLAPPAPFTHSYTGQGLYSVTLTVTDAGGCTSSLTRPNLIAISFPQAIFTMADSLTCPSSPVIFVNKSSGYGLTYAWDFGDGTTSSAANPPAHSYAIGNYTASLVVTDQYGCINSTQHSITVNVPQASFNLSATTTNCPPLIDSFTFTGSYYQSVKWNFGDGGTSSLLDPIHFYTIPGTYVDTLIVTSHGGCTDTAFSPTIHVFGPYGQLTYSPLQGCHTLTVNFNVATNNVVKYVWDFKDGQTQTTIVPSTSYTYDSAGQYVPLVILTDASGCSVPVLGTDTVLVARSFPQFGTGQTLFCNSGAVQFSDSTTSVGAITGYLWDFGDGTTSNVQNPTHFYASPGSYTVKLFVTTLAGCVDSIVKNQLVKIVANPSVDIGGISYTLCQPGTQNFQGVVLVPDTSVLRWSWNFFNGNISSVQNPPAQNYGAAGTDSVWLIVTNSTGCTDTVRKNFPIFPLPPTDAGNDTTICVGGSATLTASGAGSYTWLSPDNSISCRTCTSPVATPTTTTTYILTGYTAQGCSKSDSVTVFVIKPSVIVGLPASDSICLGQRVQLSATGESIYNWTPTAGLNNPAIANPIASPDMTTVYQVVGTDVKSCFSDTQFVKVNVFDYPTVDVGPPAVNILSGASYQINGSGSADITSILWSPPAGLSCTNCFSPLATPVNTTTYIVDVTNNGGCTTADSIRIIVSCTNGNLFVPNTFSPNDDHVNDVFYVRGTGINLVQSMIIFNRWGQVVFEKKNFAPNDPAVGWDGTINGQKAPVDVYVYTIEIVCNNSQIVPYHGNVALIR